MKENKLERFLIALFESFDSSKIEYCVIGNYKELPQYTSNDVDIWVEKYVAAEGLMLALAKSLGMKLYLQNKTANGSNNYFYYEDSKKAIKIIKVDLMVETALMSVVPIATAEFIKGNRKLYRGIWVANEVVDGIVHLLYPLVTFGVVKSKYKEKLYKLSFDDEYKDALKLIVGENNASVLSGAMSRRSWVEIEKMARPLKAYLLYRMMTKLNFYRLWLVGGYLTSIVKRLISQNGLVVSFTGVDGAGKSTIKDYLMLDSEKYFTKSRSKQFYWRPFLFPRISALIGSGGTPEVVEDSGRRRVPNKGKAVIINFIKYVYYVSDFIFGKVKYLKASHTGGLVVFDRYHFDNVIYPERFGFSLSKRVMRFVDRYFIPQPDILFYFNAESKVLYERKYEISIEEIEGQQLSYLKEITLKGGVVEIDTGVSVEDSMRQVLLVCFDYMSRRY